MDPNRTNIQGLSPSSLGEDEINISELFLVIWDGKWVIFTVVFIFAGLSVAYALKQPDIYRAEVLLSPSAFNSTASGSVAKQFGGLASLAGISLSPSGGQDKAALALEVVKSRYFISRFIQRYDLEIALLAAEGWDKDDDRLLIDDSLYDSDSNKWVKKEWSVGNGGPSLWEAHEKFVELFDVYQNKNNGMVRISVEYYSPHVSKKWVDWLVKDLNSEMKQKDLVEALSSIEYLKKQLETTQLTEMQKVFYQLIEEQTKTVMLSQVRDEYVFTTIDPAVIPEEKVKPSRALIVVIGAFVGGLLATLFLLFRALAFNNRASDVK